MAEKKDEPLACVAYEHTKCPYCGSIKTRAYKGKTDIGFAWSRYHDCNECNGRFKSREVKK